MKMIIAHVVDVILSAAELAVLREEWARAAETQPLQVCGAAFSTLMVTLVVEKRRARR